MNNKLIVLPVRARLEIVGYIVQILFALHSGKYYDINILISNLKRRSILFDDRIQQDVLIFSELIQFQAAYDPNHLITEEIQKVADRLFEDLGFSVFN